MICLCPAYLQVRSIDRQFRKTIFLSLCCQTIVSLTKENNYESGPGFTSEVAAHRAEPRVSTLFVFSGARDGPVHRQSWLAELRPQAAGGGSERGAEEPGGAGAAAGGLWRNAAAAGGLHQNHPLESQPVTGWCQAPAEGHGQGFTKSLKYSFRFRADTNNCFYFDSSELPSENMLLFTLMFAIQLSNIGL